MSSELVLYHVTKGKKCKIYDDAHYAAKKEHKRAYTAAWKARNTDIVK